MLKALAMSILISSLTLAQAEGEGAEAPATQEATIEHAEEAQEALTKEENGLPAKDEADKDENTQVENKAEPLAKPAIAAEPSPKEINKDELQGQKAKAVSVPKSKPLTAPGMLAYKPGAAAAISVGATLLGLIAFSPMMILPAREGYDKYNYGRNFAYYSGLFFIGATLGFGPLFGQFLAIGKYANYGMAIARTAVAIIPPLLAGYIYVLADKNYDGQGFFATVGIGAIVSFSAAFVWGIVDMAMTKRNLTNHVKKYKQQRHISVAPYVNHEGGGIMLGGRF